MLAFSKVLTLICLPFSRLASTLSSPLRRSRYLLFFAMIVLIGYIAVRMFYKLVVERQYDSYEYGKVEPLDWYILFSLLSLVMLGYSVHFGLVYGFDSTSISHIIFVLLIFLIQTVVFLESASKTGRLARDITIGGIIVSIYAFALFASYGLGQRTSASYVSPNVVALHQVCTKDGSELSARIIRSGEKGLLFFDTERKQVSFLPWDRIEGVRGIAPSSSKPAGGVH